MNVQRFLVLASLVVSGLAAAGCADVPDDESAAASGTEDELKAQAKKFVGEFHWDPTSTFTDFELLYLNDNGSYQAQVNSALVNPNVKCVVFPCTQAEMGYWTTTKSDGKLKISFAPAGGKPSRSYFATLSKDALSLTRYGKTTKLLVKQPDKECVASGCSGEVCADEARMSPCIFRPEFACYKKTKCERQADGQCGWTMTPAVQACLANP